jgi:hypothetical protein
MRDLREYIGEFKDILNKASETKKIKGSYIYWFFILVGVAFTAPMTYAFCYKGMSDNVLLKSWVIVAAFSPVAIMEGSVLALTYGRHYMFKSLPQRALAEVSSWIILGLLSLTSVTHFALSDSPDGYIQNAMWVYANYILPLSIVAIPALWKRLYDMDPESLIRISVIETEAIAKQEMLEIEKKKNQEILAAYRRSIDAPNVKAEYDALFERASIEHAREIAGFIRGTAPTEPTKEVGEQEYIDGSVPEEEAIEAETEEK